MKLNLTVLEYLTFFTIITGGKEEDDSYIEIYKQDKKTGKYNKVFNWWVWSENDDALIKRYGNKKIGSVETIVNDDFSTITKIELLPD